MQGDRRPMTALVADFMRLPAAEVMPKPLRRRLVEIELLDAADEARREEDIAAFDALPIEEGPDEVVITIRPPVKEER